MIIYDNYADGQIRISTGKCMHAFFFAVHKQSVVDLNVALWVL